jgi:NTE family protein
MAAGDERAGAVALVLAGGGARGAYEIGALSELLPALPEADQPEILVGTSIGALNSAILAASAHEPIGNRMRAAEALWRDLDYDDALKPIASVGGARRLFTFVGEVLGVPGARLNGVFDPAPLGDTLRDRVDFDQLRRNIGTALEALAVVTTSGVTALSVVFHQGGPAPRRDAVRGIEYVPTQITPQHVLASAAIPVAFPAVHLDDEHARGWYFDGGTRLNTPIKPAKKLGAGKVIVVALHSLTPRADGLTTGRQPDVFDGASQLLQAVLVDPLVNDVQTLAAYNELLVDGGDAGRDGRRPMPYILIAPRDPNEIGTLTSEIYRRSFDRLRDLFEDRDLALLGRILDAGTSPTHGDLLSYLFLTDELVDRLIELGRRDARAWLDEPHDDGMWQLRRLG